MTRRRWFEEWFGEEYLSLYRHRDRSEARLGAKLLAARTQARASRVLDLACGAGRHLAELRALGYAVTGMDLSRPMLREAEIAVPGVDLVRGDMRAIPFESGSFGAVTSYFTSFGYFEPEEDFRLLGEVRRILAPGGVFLLDFLNARHVTTSLKPTDELRIGDRRVIQARRVLKGRVVEKKITFQADKDAEARTFVERVRLYSPGELNGMLKAAGLRPCESFGAYDQRPFREDSSRYIVLAEAS